MIPYFRIAGAFRLRPLLCALACGLLPAVGAAASGPAPALMPRPAEVSYADGEFVLGDGISVVVPLECPARVLEIAGVLRDELQWRAGITANIVRSAAPTSGAILLTLTEAGPPADAEAYTLRIAQNAEVRASDPHGLLWGVQTLLQSVESQQAGEAVVRRVTVSDRPVRSWRALMLDPARSFLQLDFIRRTIRVMSAYKLNVLHLHLIDDQAWRFETRAFPKCNPPGEPFYTQEELRALVAFATRYGVEIVPEFDFPGHSRAEIAAYPELDCENKVRAVNEAILCSGKAFTWEFIDKIVAEAAAVFPSRYLHLGADEPFAIKRWADCPACQQRMKDKGVTSLEALYHTFVLDLNAIAHRHGRQMIVWNDAFHPGVEPAPTKDIVIDAWLGYDNAEAWAGGGYTLINSTTGPLYLTSLGLLDGLPLRAVRQWNATRFASPDPKRGAQTVQYRELSAHARLLGGQACAWATEQGLVEQRLYPRLLSVAESLWAEGREGDLADFEARLHPAQERLLGMLGVPADETRPRQALFDGRDTAAWIAVGPPAFVVAKGELVAAGGPGRGWLRTKETFRDFILTFERWAPVAGDETGIVYGCDPARAAGAVPDGRAVSAAPPADLFTPTRTLHPPAQWSRYELVVRGGVTTLTIGGRLAWSVADPAPAAGAIGLTGGPGVKYRAMTIRPLAANPSP